MTKRKKRKPAFYSQDILNRIDVLSLKIEKDGKRLRGRTRKDGMNRDIKKIVKNAVGLIWETESLRGRLGILK